MADNKFFTNTYITGSGRQNYLRIDKLEDPLFTSFTFDVDFITSPLFYTINNTDYGYQSGVGICESIESALKQMYSENMNIDQGYDILPVLSASILDGKKLGFGLQQNVYMDMPLYGAVEYIYMVDKRNGNSSQNDVRNNNETANSGGNVNTNSYKLGDSGVKDIVSESDKAFEEKKQQQNEEVANQCLSIMDDKNVIDEHNKNVADFDAAFTECNNIKEIFKDENGNNIEYTEDDLIKKVDEYKNKVNGFKQLKKDIVKWVNGILSEYHTKGTNIYRSNQCVQKIFSYSDIDKNKEKYVEQLSTSYGSDFRKEKLFESNSSYISEFKKLYNELISYTWDSTQIIGWKQENNNSFLEDKLKDDAYSTVRQTKVIEKYKNKLVEFGLYKDDNSFNGDIFAGYNASVPDWVKKSESHLDKFKEGDANYKGVYKAIKDIMSVKCNNDSAFSAEFTSDTVKNNEKMLSEYEAALVNIRKLLYGMNGNEVCDRTNPNPNSPYGRYIASKNKCENDEYSQAEKTLASTGYSPNNKNDRGDSDSDNDSNVDTDNDVDIDIDIDGDSDSDFDMGDSDDLDYNDPIYTAGVLSEVTVTAPRVAPRTVIDMLGFISGMKKLTNEYPYIIQSITGLDTAYNKHYYIKDPYLGSGDDKITLSCLESLDLRVSSMFNRYFNAVYDRQYRRERVPVNLRRFNCSVYVHDVRNFVSRNRGSYSNRIIELTDMYNSVIEFRFYDCEIVPEETGNIFNDISNESPSEMKKTNFTFTYGNCVVNFVPPSKVAEHNDVKK